MTTRTVLLDEQGRRDLRNEYQSRREQGFTLGRALSDALDVLARKPHGLVVIDPEDREQVERLDALIDAELWSKNSPKWAGPADVLQQALREFAAPTPPKPDEPTGRYAVVEDGEDGEWCRIDQANGYVWQLLGQPSGACRYAMWHQIDAVRVLSEGVQ